MNSIFLFAECRVLLRVLVEVQGQQEEEVGWNGELKVAE